MVIHAATSSIASGNPSCSASRAGANLGSRAHRDRAIGRRVPPANDAYGLRCLSRRRDRLHEDECCDEANRYGRTGLSVMARNTERRSAYSSYRGSPALLTVVMLRIATTAQVSIPSASARACSDDSPRPAACSAANRSSPKVARNRATTRRRSGRPTIGREVASASRSASAVPQS